MHHGYQVDFELAKMHQREFRETRAQDRLAQQAQPTTPRRIWWPRLPRLDTLICALFRQGTHAAPHTGA